MKILETEILSGDLSATKLFYTGVLGFTLTHESDASISFAVGASSLAFKKTGELQPVYHFAFLIPSNKTEDALSWLSSRHETIKISDGNPIAEFDDWNARAFYFYDNNGNILEFIARTDLGNISNAPFSTTSILSLNEVAVVTDDASELAAELTTKWELPLFPKQPLKENFGACGNDDGLIIISQENRHWYPTEVYARKFYTRIKLNNGGKIQELTFNKTSD